MKNLLNSKRNFGCLPAQVMPGHEPEGPQAAPNEKSP